MAWQAEIAFIWPELAFMGLWADCERTGSAIGGHRQDWSSLAGQLEWTGLEKEAVRLAMISQEWLY
jgi:hypothetical protein